MKSIMLLFLGCMSFVSGAETPEVPGKAQSIPAIARLAGVQVGYSTQEDLARQWGEGKVVIGDHPNSGRLWRVKRTNWTVHTDGFQYSSRGLVVDGIEVSPEKPQPGVPFAKAEKKDFAWLSGLVPGMSRQQVAKWVKEKSLKSTATHQGIEISAKGLCPLVQGQFTTWTANLYFKKERLSGLALAATE